MTTKTTSIETPAHQIALSRLCLSLLNPRQSVPDDDIANMADSIRSAGLIQNLAGLISAPDQATGQIEIVAGGRRLRALQLIAEEDGLDPETVLVPVILTEDKAEAEAWAGAENIVRAPLHPADEVRAYANMAEGGASVVDIAKAFAVTVRHVQGRLKLAGLPAPILDALKANEITLDVAAAYTIAKTPERALEVFETAKDSYYNDRPGEIRSRITDDAADASHRVAKFVGRARYEANGGAVTEDLFGENVFYDDSELVGRLAEEQLQKAAAEVVEAGWKWAKTSFDRPCWQDYQKYSRTYPTHPIGSEEDTTRYEELTELVECEEATDEQVEEYNTLAEFFEREDWTERQKVFAGAFLYIGYDGALEIDYGYVKPDDRAAAEEAGVCKPNRHASVAATDKPKGAYPAKLLGDMAKVRTCAVQTALLDKPALALDLLAFALSEACYAGALPLGVSTTDAVNAPDTDEGLSVHDRVKAVPYDAPLNGKKAADAFIKFRGKSQKARNAILTESIAKLVGVGVADDTANPFAEMVATLAGADVRKVWVPTASFLTRLKAGQLDAIMEHIDGKQLPAGFAKMKKGEKVDRLHRIFANEKGIPPLTTEQKARVAAWRPEVMQITPPAPEKASRKTAPRRAAKAA